MAAAAVLPTQVPPPPQEVPVNVDNLQDLLRRKREIEKNKYKYHLTEADANLILTNANEYTFNDGQVILEEGHENASVYRIKSGKVELSKNGHVFCELAQGWFIGETLFLDNKRADVIEASLIAKGTVTLAEVNLPFVKKLFEVDRILALKFYRNLASKLSSIFYAISGNLMSPCLVKMFQQQIQESTSSSSLSLTNSITSSPSLSSISSSSTSSSSSSSSNGGSATGSPALAHSGSGTSISVTPARNTLVSCPNVPQASVEVANRRRRLSKRRSISLAHSAYKVYTLENDGKGIQTCKLKNKKIKIINEAFGFKHKTTIHFAKIRNIVRTSEVSITVIFDPLKAKTLFFKTVQDLEEFYGLTQSLVETSTKLLQKSSPNTPLSHVASPLSFRLKDSTDSKLLPLNSRDNKEQQELDKEVMQSLATKLELRKGEILVEEGDLFQRIYTITKGQCETVTNGHVVSTMKEGEVFGEASLLHLRPAPVTIRVSSEACSVLIIPAYKLHELINSNPVLAVRIFKKTAALVENKIDRVLATRHQIASEYCPQYANMVLERLNL